VNAFVSVAFIAAEHRGDELRALVPEAQGSAHVSVSHTAGLSAIAWSDIRVGVDVERVQPRVMLDRLAARTMRDDERERWLATDDRDRAFAQHWTRVESYLKAIGEGVRGGYLTRPPGGWSVVDLDLRSPHVGALAVDGEAPTITVRWIRSVLNPRSRL
jgi:4'-phosphopantetheinyl transferase